MHILDYNQFVETMFCQRNPLGGPGYDDPSCCHSSNKNQEKTLSEGFNTYAVTLPNGCIVTMNEAGEVHIKEKNSAAKKLRHKDPIQQHLVQ